MSRALLLCCAAVLALPACAGSAALHPPPPGPTGDLGPGTSDFKPLRNVLFIIGDDHAAYALSGCGNTAVRTPRLDRLAAEGTRFDRAYVNSPLCTASRQSMLTGRLPHAVGVTLLTTPLADGTPTLASHLKSVGFDTAGIGKMHFNGPLRHGFDVLEDTREHQAHLKEHPPRPAPPGTAVKPPWHPFRDPARVWLNADVLPVGLHDEDCQGTWLARRAVDFMAQHRDRRFLLWLGFHEPHSPFDFPLEFAGRRDPATMPLPKAGPEDARWIPAIFRGLPDADARGIVASYYTSVEYLDRNVGFVLDGLRDLGLDGDTLVVYVGDNGYLLGHHGRFEKHTMWEEAVRVPLMIRAGDRFPGGRTADGMVQCVDLAPTVCELLGAPTMEGFQGRNLRPLLAESKVQNPKSKVAGADAATSDLGHRTWDAAPEGRLVFSEYLEDDMAMVRTEGWKYVFMTGARDLAIGYATGEGPPGVTHFLYDMKSDPGETHNLAADPGHAAVRREMQDRLLRRFRETDPRAASIPQTLPVEQQLARFCVPPEGRR